MIKDVSEAWIENQNQYMTSRANIEITCDIIDPTAQKNAKVSADGTTYYSDMDSVTALDDYSDVPIATLEWNFWCLDGSFTLPDTASSISAGSGYAGTGNKITISFPEVMYNPIPGIVISWGKIYGEYPESFSVAVKNAGNTVGSASVSNNTSMESIIDTPFQEYDSIEITISSWNIPNRRYRIRSVVLGWSVSFDKNDILTFNHSSIADPISGVLPKNSVDFSISNYDNKWDITDERSFARYITERQKVSTRYGFEINGSTEWIKGGVFYLHEWKTASNGLNVQFVARDAIEFMLDELYKTDEADMTLYDHCVSAFSQSSITIDYVLDERLKEYSVSVKNAEYSIAELLQYCANAIGDGIYQDRDGVIHVENVSVEGEGDYIINRLMQYDHPETELSKPLGSVTVTYADNLNYTVETDKVGVNQTLQNTFITSQEQAYIVAEKTIEYLGVRETLSVNYRADPRLDVFDFVRIYGKDGYTDVLATEIDYNFSGAFRATIKGRKARAPLYLADVYGNKFETIDGYLLVV